MMKRHRFDPFAFLFGAAFLTIGLTVAFGASGAGALELFRSWPAAIIATGFVLVAWTVARVLRPAVEGGAGTDTEPDHRAEPEADEIDTEAAELDEDGPPPSTP
jgi:hypothetical protein